MGEQKRSIWPYLVGKESGEASRRAGALAEAGRSNKSSVEKKTRRKWRLQVGSMVGAFQPESETCQRQVAIRNLSKAGCNKKLPSPVNCKIGRNDQEMTMPLLPVGYQHNLALLFPKETFFSNTSSTSSLVRVKCSGVNLYTPSAFRKMNSSQRWDFQQLSWGS